MDSRILQSKYFQGSNSAVLSRESTENAHFMIARTNPILCAKVYGFSLSHTAKRMVVNNEYEIVRGLLESGLDPNSYTMVEGAALPFNDPSVAHLIYKIPLIFWAARRTEPVLPGRSRNELFLVLFRFGASMDFEVWPGITVFDLLLQLKWSDTCEYTIFTFMDCADMIRESDVEKMLGYGHLFLQLKRSLPWNYICDRTTKDTWTKWMRSSDGTTKQFDWNLFIERSLSERNTTHAVMDRIINCLDYDDGKTACVLMIQTFVDLVLDVSGLENAVAFVRNATDFVSALAYFGFYSRKFGPAEVSFANMLERATRSSHVKAQRHMHPYVMDDMMSMIEICDRYHVGEEIISTNNFQWVFMSYYKQGRADINFMRSLATARSCDYPSSTRVVTAVIDRAVAEALMLESQLDMQMNFATDGHRAKMRALFWALIGQDLSLVVPIEIFSLISMFSLMMQCAFSYETHLEKWIHEECFRAKIPCTLPSCTWKQSDAVKQ